MAKEQQGDGAPSPPPQRGRPRKMSWDRVAGWYDSLAGDRGSEYQQAVVFPGALRLLALRHGEAVLDLACGQGAFSRALHTAGARVKGVDASAQLIAMARRRSPRAIRYLVADARRLDGLETGSFDAVACVLAIQNMDPVEPVLTECARVLKLGGRLVIVMMHPAFRIPRQSHWGWDEERKLQFRAVDRYLSEMKIPIDTRPFKAPGQVTWTYHRPLQSYVNGLASAGFVVDALEEWPSHRVSQPGPAAQAEDRAREEFPLFLALRAVRTQASAQPSQEMPERSVEVPTSPRPARGRRRSNP